MPFADYTSRKTLDEIAATADDQERGLARSLGPMWLIGLGIGCIVGAGIFVLTGKAAASYAGPAISLSFVLVGIACAFVGLCYAELTAMIPTSGSAYTFTYATVGEAFAWIIGWGEQYDGRFQAVRGLRGDRRWRHVHQSRTLDPVHSPERRQLRRIWLERHPAWLLRRVLRLFPLRCGLHRGAGGTSPTAGHAYMYFSYGHQRVLVSTEASND